MLLVSSIAVSGAVVDGVDVCSDIADSSIEVLKAGLDVDVVNSAAVVSMFDVVTVVDTMYVVSSVAGRIDVTFAFVVVSMVIVGCSIVAVVPFVAVVVVAHVVDRANGVCSVFVCPGIVIFAVVGLVIAVDSVVETVVIVSSPVVKGKVVALIISSEMVDS